VSPIETVSLVTLTTTPVNPFGVMQEYQQPTATPISEDWWRPLLTDMTPTPLTMKREVADIIYPYLSITSFIFNLTWRWMQGVISSLGHASITKVILDKHFDSADLDGVNFANIEKQIAMDVQSPWGSNGWRRDTIIIEVPTGQKPTAASHRAAANAQAHSQRHDKVDPDADPFWFTRSPFTTSAHAHSHKLCWRPFKMVAILLSFTGLAARKPGSRHTTTHPKNEYGESCTLLMHS
jgi:hypothetical protein